MKQILEADMRYKLTALVFCALLAHSGSAGSALPVSKAQARTWILHVTPLPKSIEISGKVAVPRSGVTIMASGNGGLLARQAYKELQEVVGASGVGRTAFTVKLQVGGPEAERLRALRNPDQSYAILPGAGDKGLKLVALSPRGLYYASKTLQQLIQARSAGDTVEMPIMRATDWPDMEDRGLWGADSYLHLRRLGDLKMNYIEQISIVGVDEQGHPYAQIKPGHAPLLKEGPLYGIEFVPVILHLEQVGGKGVFKAYPNLKGQSPHEGAICYSQPQFIDILAEWIAQFGSLPGVREVDVWMTENLCQLGGCQCEECKRTDRSVLEVRTILAAWRKAREKAPGVGLRILTSEETEYSNEMIFKEVPPEVKVWYYHSLLTYNTGETPVLWRKYLSDFAGGHWLGVCPNLNSTVAFTQPFTGADFIHYRMNEFVDKKVSGLIGYASPRLYYYWFNVEGTAEWSWNAKGRSPHEFALSYAVRHRIANPEKFAEWADTIGPVEWDIYGSDWPSGEQRTTPGPVAEALRQGKLPELGYVLWDAYRVPFGDIKSVQQLDADVAAAEKALKLAKQMGTPELINEALIAQGEINSLKALWELKRLVKPEGIADRDKDAAQRWFRVYVDGLKQAADSLPKWEACIDSAQDQGPFTRTPVDVINVAIEQMRKVAGDFGIESH